MSFCLQEAESNRLCRRLRLKDIIPVEMQRLTKYPLLLDNIAKYTGGNRTEHTVTHHPPILGFHHLLFVWLILLQRTVRRGRRWREPANVVKMSSTTSTRPSKRQRTNRYRRWHHSKMYVSAFKSTEGLSCTHFQLCVFSAEAGRVSAKVGSVFTETKWKPIDPGAEGNKQATSHSQQSYIL